MTLSTNDHKLKDLLAEILLIDDGDYLDNHGPDEIETWDSLAMIKIASAVEKEFGYAMSPEEMVSLTSIGDIKEILASHGHTF